MQLRRFNLKPAKIVALLRRQLGESYKTHDGSKLIRGEASASALLPGG